VKKINESSYSVLMTFNRFVREQQATKREVMSQKMNELYDELRVEMDAKGWSSKGRNNVTSTMLNTSTWKFKFSKVYDKSVYDTNDTNVLYYSGQEVVLEMQGNLRDDYLSSGGYNQFKIIPEIPELLSSYPFTWDEEGNTKLGLSILLDKIEQHFNR
jgi:hypothetical protein